MPRLFKRVHAEELLHISRKAADTPLSVIRAQLQAEQLVLGKQKLSHRLLYEKRALAQLKEEQNNYQQFLTHCLSHLLEPKSGVSLSFKDAWQHQQARLKKAASHEKREEREEKIDWLEARQQLAKILGLIEEEKVKVADARPKLC